MDIESIKERFAGHVPAPLEFKRQSAVMILIGDFPEGPAIVYEKRTGTISHAGETCFPGGRIDPGEDPKDAACRETFEELGLAEGRDFTLLGKYGDFYAITSNHIYIYAAILEPGAYERIVKQDSEVAEVFRIPLDYLTSAEPTWYRYKAIQETREDFPRELLGMPSDYCLPSGKYEMPIWVYEGHVLWGMTARMTIAFLRDIII